MFGMYGARVLLVSRFQGCAVEGQVGDKSGAEGAVKRRYSENVIIVGCRSEFKFG
jgi:ribosomal protein L35AE/L33A